MIYSQYMTESEILDRKIMLESEIDMLEISMKADLINEDGKDTDNKFVRTFKKIINQIKTIIDNIISKIKSIFTSKKEKEIQDNLNDMEDIELSFDPKKSLDNMEKSVKSSLKDLKNTKAGKFVSNHKNELKVAGKVVISAASAFGLYKSYSKFMGMVDGEATKLNDEITFFAKQIESSANSKNGYADALEREYIACVNDIKKTSVNAGTILNILVKKLAAAKVGKHYGLTGNNSTRNRPGDDYMKAASARFGAK